MSGAKRPAPRFVSASERSVFLCEGVALLGARNHHTHGTTAYDMADALWSRWVKDHPELEAKARKMQADAFDFCNTL